MIRHITITDITSHTTAAKRDGLVFCAKTDLFGLYEDGLLLGFTGLLRYRHKIIFKNHYVLPAYRRRGHFRCMLDWSMRTAISEGFKTVEATCTTSSLPEYLNRGFIVVRKYEAVTKVRKRL